MLAEFLNLIDFTKIRRDAADNVCWMLTNVGLLQSNPSINCPGKNSFYRQLAKKEYSYRGLVLHMCNGLCLKGLLIYWHVGRGSMLGTVMVIFGIQSLCASCDLYGRNGIAGRSKIEELTKNAVELKACEPSVGVPQKSGEVLCEHRDGGTPHFAHGLCKNCYEDFIELSGGLHGGSEPPAFQRAERERIAMASANKGDESSVPQQETENIEEATEMVEKVKSFTESSQKATENEQLNQRENESNSATGDQIEVDDASDKCQKSKDKSSITDDESDGLSDIDDVEIDGYLNNDEETCYKAIIWEQMNKEYLEEQAAAAAAKMEASHVDFENCSDEVRAAHELAAAATAAVAKSRKERKRKQDLNANPAQTAAEAAHQMLIKKPPSDSNKKAKTANGDGDVTGQSDGEKEHNEHITDNYDELGEGYEDMDQEDAIGPYGNGLVFENEEDVYDYDNGDEEY
uniref:Brf1 TBP-binding domain-containing protein n=1 Tax=Fagus sylvatica TaxID=28930 RepID=A0A2N9EP25_FAGSY